MGFTVYYLTLQTNNVFCKSYPCCKQYHTQHRNCFPSVSVCMNSFCSQFHYSCTLKLLLIFFHFILQSDMIHQSVFEFIHIDDRAMFRRQLHFALNPTLLNVEADGQSVFIYFVIDQFYIIFFLYLTMYNKYCCVLEHLKHCDCRIIRIYQGGETL